jgi:hypothetical protein
VHLADRTGGQDHYVISGYERFSDFDSEFIWVVMEICVL